MDADKNGHFCTMPNLLSSLSNGWSNLLQLATKVVRSLLEGRLKQANRYPALGKKLFYLAHGVLPKMKDARGQDGIGPPRLEHIRHVLQRTGTAAGDHRHADRFTHAPS